MEDSRWHHDFRPSRFVGKVDLARLISPNAADTELSTEQNPQSCLLCASARSTGLLLNDRSFVCRHCFAEVSLISYPERYEALRRSHLVALESRRLARAEFELSCKPPERAVPWLFVLAGLGSFLLLLLHPSFAVAPAVFAIIALRSSAQNRQEQQQWLRRSREWDSANPVPPDPILKHFHDPSAELSARDRLILRIFEHWPGYPPYWQYLRHIVLERDSRRCQVTGCPSRLELHVHHRQPTAGGGAHAPANLITLCQFHHALEPDPGHGRIWGEVRTEFFTLVNTHERGNRVGPGAHRVRSHLRRLKLVTLADLRDIVRTYGLSCPSCGTSRIRFLLSSDRNHLAVECPLCGWSTELRQELAEETGPRLAEVLAVTRNRGGWVARWDTLSQRKSSGATKNRSGSGRST